MAKSKPDRNDNSDMRIAPKEILAQFGFNDRDYVVPRFTEEGRKIADGGAVLPSPVNKAAQAIMRHALNHGAQTSKPPVPVVVPQPMVKTAQVLTSKVKGQRGKPASRSGVTPLESTPAPMFPPEPVITPKQTVVFNTPFGKMRMSVEAVLRNEIGFCLVFSSENAMQFVPEVGSVLSMTLPEADISAMYTGCSFKMHNTDQQLMFFVLYEPTAN